jgi:hypothetical protein
MAGKNTSSTGKNAGNSKRTFYVFISLLGSLSVLAVVLQVLSPPPARPQQSVVSLYSQDGGARLPAVMLPPSRPWKYIYIHQSKTSDGNAQTLAGKGELGDHFVIGNGSLAGDGELEFGRRWLNQLPAKAPAGIANIHPDCISVCLIGDLDRSAPTEKQIDRLSDLVRTLQARHGIAASQVITIPQIDAGGIGGRFPANRFKKMILANPVQSSSTGPE